MGAQGWDDDAGSLFHGAVRTGSRGTFPVRQRGSCLLRAKCLEGLMAMRRELARARRNVATEDQAAQDADHSCHRGSGPGDLTPAWTLEHSMTSSLS